MNTRSRIAFVVLAALLTLPTVALSREHGRGRGHSDQQSNGSTSSRGDRHGRGQSGRSTWSRGGERAFRMPSPGRIERGDRDRDRDAVRRIARGDIDRRYAPRDRGSWRRSDGRSDTRYRGDARTYGGYRNDSSTRYKPSGPIVQRDQGYRGRRTSRHSYYVGDFYRPRYVVRSGFFIGLSLGAFPSYGYRYYDPYCGEYFRGLGSYGDHCHGLGHPSAILVIDDRTDTPIATCIYDDGDWVVDDCAGDGDYARDDESGEEYGDRY